MAACFASHSLAADSTSVSSTGCRLKVERLITLSTSAVVVCCTNRSLHARLRACTSPNKRTVSMAMTAWSANVVTSSICLAVNGCGVVLVIASAPAVLPSREAELRERPGNRSSVGSHDKCIPDRPTHRGYEPLCPRLPSARLPSLDPAESDARRGILQGRAKTRTARLHGRAHRHVDRRRRFSRRKAALPTQPACRALVGARTSSG